MKSRTGRKTMSNALARFAVQNKERQGLALSTFLKYTGLTASDLNTSIRSHPERKPARHVSHGDQGFPSAPSGAFRLRAVIDAFPDLIALIINCRSLEAAIHALLDCKDSLGELDNTIVMLASDNGASAEGGEHGTFNECLYPNRVEPGIEDNLKYLDDWGSVRSYPNYSWGWAWAGNTPLKRWKRYLHQGGMSDPLVVHWPKGIEATGEVRKQYVHVVDITPTLLDVLGIEAPKNLNGAAQKPMEGVSFAHTLNAPEAPTKKTAQYYEMLGSRAIWSDGWKAVAEQPQGVELTEEKLASMKWELYHVAEDFSESVDLA